MAVDAPWTLVYCTQLSTIAIYNYRSINE